MNESAVKMNEKREYCIIIITAMICTISFIFDKSFIILSLTGCFYFFRTGCLFLDEGSRLKRCYLTGLVLTGCSFSMISGTWISYLLLWFCMDAFFLNKQKNKNIFRCCTPIFLFTAYIFFFYLKKLFYQFFLEAAAICIFVLIFTWADKAYERYQRSIYQLNTALCKSALIELEEKKLNKELAIKNYLIDRNARYEERERISRDIHNLAGHSITAALMALDASELLYESEPVKSREKMLIAKERIHEGLSSIRHAVRVLDDFSGTIHLNDFVNSLLLIFSRLMMDSSIIIRHNLERTEECIELDVKHSEFLKGAVSEFITNGIKHGSADAFLVMLHYDTKHIRIRVSDNGTKFGLMTEEEQREKLNHGFGLKKIKEYTTNFGGDLVCGYHDGFRVELTLFILKADKTPTSIGGE